MLATLQDLRAALQNDCIVPCFQPLVELRSGQLTGFEVLARWRHPDLGLTLPSNFISLAEESGLIGLLSRQILRKAFQAASGWPAHLSLAVNVSPVQLRDRTILSQVSAEAAETGFNLSRLTIEITESAIVDNVGMAAEIAWDLKLLGCRLALDDFGTGYSSLVHLQALPFDELKLDRSFVQAMTSRQGSRKIVSAVMGLGHSLGLITIAEGVETEEQADMLLHLGCEVGQGWLFGRPVEGDHVADRMAAAYRTPVSPAIEAGDPRMSLSLEALPARQAAQLRAIYDGAPTGLCFLDTQMRYISINSQLAEMNGLPMRSHLGKTPAEMIPDIFDVIEPHLRKASQGIRVSNVQNSRLGKNAGDPVRTYLASYSPAFDEFGEVIGVSIGVVDITERKQVEDALRKTEEQYKRFLEISPHAPWEAGPQGDMVEVSPRWLEMTGLTREESLGFGWLAAVHREDIQVRMTALREAIATVKPFLSEYRLKTAGGGWRWVCSRGWPQLSSTGEVERWQGYLEDIDEQKRLAKVMRACEECGGPGSASCGINPTKPCLIQ